MPQQAVAEIRLPAFNGKQLVWTFEYENEANLKFSSLPRPCFGNRDPVLAPASPANGAGPDPRRPRHLITEPGMGYRFTA